MIDLDTILHMYGSGKIFGQQILRQCHRPSHEIIDVDYVEITDEGEIQHTVNQKLIENGKDNARPN